MTVTIDVEKSDWLGESKWEMETPDNISRTERIGEVYLVNRSIQGTFSMFISGTVVLKETFKINREEGGSAVVRNLFIDNELVKTKVYRKQ